MSTVYCGGGMYTNHMEQPTDINQFDQSALQNLLNNSNTSLIPESLVTTLIVSFVIINVLGVLFLIFYVLGIIRKWKVQSAVLSMQKDLAEIKATLAKPSQPADVPTPVVQPPQNIVQPERANRTIASSDDPSDTRTS